MPRSAAEQYGWCTTGRRRQTHEELVAYGRISRPSGKDRRTRTQSFPAEQATDRTEQAADEPAHEAADLTDDA